VEPISVAVGDGQTVDVLVATPYFAKCRHTLAEPSDYGLGAIHGSYRTLHCRAGAALLGAGTQVMRMEAGDTVFVPACREEEVRVEPDGDCVLFDDTLPDIPALTGFLGRNGAPADAIEALLSPARAAGTPA
jgi:mannose-6-phosphate isomerase class I